MNVYFTRGALNHLHHQAQHADRQAADLAKAKVALSRALIERTVSRASRREATQ